MNTKSIINPKNILPSVRSFAFLILPFLFIGFGGLQAQMTICNGENICLTVTARGNVQWQESADSLTWTDINGAVADTFCFLATASSWYRAEVREGTCDPIYSDPQWIDVNPAVVADAGGTFSFCSGDSVMIGGAVENKIGTGRYQI